MDDAGLYDRTSTTLYFWGDNKRMCFSSAGMAKVLHSPEKLRKPSHAREFARRMLRMGMLKKSVGIIPLAKHELQSGDMNKFACATEPSNPNRSTGPDLDAAREEIRARCKFVAFLSQHGCAWMYSWTAHMGTTHFAKSVTAPRSRMMHGMMEIPSTNHSAPNTSSQRASLPLSLDLGGQAPRGWASHYLMVSLRKAC